MLVKLKTKEWSGQKSTRRAIFLPSAWKLLSNKQTNLLFQNIDVFLDFYFCFVHRIQHFMAIGKLPPSTVADKIVFKFISEIYNLF